ncbi:MAG: hypothetical protein ACI92E_000049 [Oceanicoccus sp.]|jgi:uncharacterized protein (DUF58 family)
MFSKVKERFKLIIRSRYLRWINRRIPSSRSITLNQKRIFIFPSKPGLWFFACLLVMLLAAINYENNMAFALVFFLASLFVVTILHTFGNLSGLTITAIRALPSFVGDSVEFQLLVSRQGQRNYFDIEFSWPESEIEIVTLKNKSEQLLRLHLPAKERGFFTPDRVLVETQYPIGLLRAWTWIALDIGAVIYPKPMASELIASSTSDRDEGEVIPVSGTDDFYQFREYQVGDPLKHIHWKSFSKGQELQTKQFASYREQRLWLDWDNFSGDVEKRLENICYWVLKLEREDSEYGIRLPGLEIQPNHGTLHQEKVLSALSLYRFGGDPK